MEKNKHEQCTLCMYRHSWLEKVNTYVLSCNDTEKLKLKASTWLYIHVRRYVALCTCVPVCMLERGGDVVESSGLLQAAVLSCNDTEKLKLKASIWLYIRAYNHTCT